MAVQAATELKVTLVPGRTGRRRKTQEEDASGNYAKPDTETSAKNGKILVVYFSHSGNTKKIAEKIQKKTDAELFEIKTVHVYSDDYNTVLDEAKAEQKDNVRPELDEKVTDMSQYQTVILGYDGSIIGLN